MKALWWLFVAGLLVTVTLWYVHGGKVDVAPCPTVTTRGAR